MRSLLKISLRLSEYTKAAKNVGYFLAVAGGYVVSIGFFVNAGATLYDATLQEYQKNKHGAAYTLIAEKPEDLLASSSSIMETKTFSTIIIPNKPTISDWALATLEVSKEIFSYSSKQIIEYTFTDIKDKAESSVYDRISEQTLLHRARQIRDDNISDGDISNAVTVETPNSIPSSIPIATTSATRARAEIQPCRVEILPSDINDIFFRQFKVSNADAPRLGFEALSKLVTQHEIAHCNEHFKFNDDKTNADSLTHFISVNLNLDTNDINGMSSYLQILEKTKYPWSKQRGERYADVYAFIVAARKNWINEKDTSKQQSWVNGIDSFINFRLDDKKNLEKSTHHTAPALGILKHFDYEQISNLNAHQTRQLAEAISIYSVWIDVLQNVKKFMPPNHALKGGLEKFDQFIKLNSDTDKTYYQNMAKIIAQSINNQNIPLSDSYAINKPRTLNR